MAGKMALINALYARTQSVANHVNMSRSGSVIFCSWFRRSKRAIRIFGRTSNDAVRVIERVDHPAVADVDADVSGPP